MICNRIGSLDPTSFHFLRDQTSILSAYLRIGRSSQGIHGRLATYLILDWLFTFSARQDTLISRWQMITNT